MAWTTVDIPDLTGRRALVTGANAGLGFETALGLAAHGADVALAARDTAKGEAALARIRAAHPAAKVRLEALDLASLASVDALAQRLSENQPALDILVNNAGMISRGGREVTADGFERQLGVNYLGHFALTGRLLPLLRAGSAARVVNLSSGAHHMGRIALDDLQQARGGYSRWRAYAQSKLAMLMFAQELQRRSDAGGWGLLSLAAHPGYARTEFVANGADPGGWEARIDRTVGGLFSQSAADGALPTLYAATAPGVRPAGYYGPTGALEVKGPPGPARISKPAQDRAVAAALWSASEALTGVRFG